MGRGTSRGGEGGSRPRPGLRLLLLAGLLGVLPPAARAQLESIASDDIVVIYPAGAFDYVLPHVLGSMENALRYHRQLYAYEPSEPITVFLEDFSDYGHGGATTVPNNFVNLGVAPFSYVYDTVPAIDRMYWMSNHELAHVVTMDQAASRDATFRKLFGGKVAPTGDDPLSILYNYLTNPRWNAPRWYHEGIAVFLETWMAGGLGRVMGGYDEMVFRTMVRDDRPFYDTIGLESEGTTVDFQVGVNSYLYGTRFMSYLAYTYGPEKLIAWTARHAGSKGYFSQQFAHVYGTSLEHEWSRWIELEREWQEDNLARVRRYPTTPVEPLTDEPLGSVPRAFLDPDAGELYVAVRSPGQLASLIAIDLDSGEVRKIATLEGAAIFYVTSLAYDAATRTLFHTSDNYGWRDLYATDARTGRTRRLLRDQRIGDLAFDRADRSLWGVRHFAGISTVVRIPYPYEAWEQVHSFPYGEDLHDIDLSPDGATLTGALAEVDGTWRLVRIDVPELLEGELELDVLYDFENSSPANFVFSPDGRFLYGSSYYSGVSNVYRYDLEAADIDILSNAETGLFRPVPTGDGEVIVFEFTGRGLRPGTIADRRYENVAAIRFLGQAIVEAHPVVESWQAGSPRSVELEHPDVREEEYRPLRNVRFDTIYPIVEGYKSSPAVGLRLDLSDRLDLSRLDLTASVSSDDELEASERLHLALGFHHWDWTVEASYNLADFYDLFGPTKTSRRGYSLGLGYGKTLLYDEPRALRFGVEATGYGDLEIVPGYQNVPATSDRLLRARARLDYELVRRSLGAVDDEKGIRWELVASGNYTNDTTSPLLRGDLHYGIPLPIDHSSLWIRGSAGQSFGDRNDTFALFFFGGFGNNFVDHQNEKRYREYTSFPGLEINEVAALDYGKVMLEWNLPPLRFRHAGFSSLYLNWARFALFGTALLTELDSDSLRRTLWNAGLQVDLKLVLFSNLSSMLSVGYGVAGGEGRRPSDELMISLKIL